MSYRDQLQMIGELANIGKVEDAHQALQDLKVKAEEADKLLNMLEIPHDTLGMVDGIDLFEILMNEKKLKNIIAKLNNKAFW